MSSFSTPVLFTTCQHLTTFSASGADARTFLQSQLTQDLTKVSSDNAALAGFCTAQGRLWASMLLAQNANDQAFIGIVSADLVETFLKRLRMFVLRSKVTIEPTPMNLVYGVQLALSDLASLSNLVGGDLPATTWASTSTAGGLWVRIPSTTNDSVRLLWVANPVQFDDLIKALDHQAQQLATSNDWQVQDIKAGLAWVQASTQDLFIAQTLNLDLIGGVSFTKGCYPGQEVIARAHYRGTVKRRMHLAKIASAESSLRAGMDVFDANEPKNPVGRLINVAHDGNDSSQTWVLFEAPFKTLAGEPLRAGSADGAALVLQSLPYEVIEQ